VTTFSQKSHSSHIYGCFYCGPVALPRTCNNECPNVARVECVDCKERYFLFPFILIWSYPFLHSFAVSRWLIVFVVVAMMWFIKVVARVIIVDHCLHHQLVYRYHLYPYPPLVPVIGCPDHPLLLLHYQCHSQVLPHPLAYEYDYGL
jgi:hypothetical protein